ncbi:MAG: ATP-binding protein, partial [Pseudoclavibacter sp.]
EARAGVIAARETAGARLAGTPRATNREASGKWLRSAPMRIPPAETTELDRALDRGLITMRGYDRVLRVAWSIADLEGADRPGRAHLREALFYRMSARGAA